MIDELDIKAESVPLSVAERAAKKEAYDFLYKLRREEETKWAQCAKVKHIQEGGITRNIFTLLLMGNIEKRGFFSWNRMKGP